MRHTFLGRPGGRIRGSWVQGGLGHGAVHLCSSRRKKETIQGGSQPHDTRNAPWHLFWLAVQIFASVRLAAAVVLIPLHVVGPTSSGRF
eukprot:5410599-Pyramimonas_sp.AAC.1